MVTVAGKKKNQGKVFEEDWKDSYDGLPFFYMRLKDSAKWEKGETARFTPENPCDSIQHTIPFLWLLELKSTEGSGISFNKETPWLKDKERKSMPMIKPNQVSELSKAVSSEGIVAGFVLNFRERELKTRTEPNEVFFVHIKDFLNFAVSSGKSSISREDARDIGVHIFGNKKKVHYTYDIQDFVERAIVHYLAVGLIDIGTIDKIYRWSQGVIQSYMGVEQR